MVMGNQVMGNEQRVKKEVTSLECGSKQIMLSLCCWVHGDKYQNNSLNIII